MQNKRTLFKVGAGAVAVSALIAGVVIGTESSSQFSSDGKMTSQDYEFMSYISTYGKSYATTSEYKQRQSNYAAEDSRIRAYNADPNATSTCGHNALSDKSEVELKSMKGYVSKVGDTFGSPTSITFINETDNDAAVDWINTRSGQSYQYFTL